MKSRSIRDRESRTARPNAYSGRLCQSFQKCLLVSLQNTLLPCLLNQRHQLEILDANVRIIKKKGTLSVPQIKKSDHSSDDRVEVFHHVELPVSHGSIIVHRHTSMDTLKALPAVQELAEAFDGTPHVSPARSACSDTDISVKASLFGTTRCLRTWKIAQLCLIQTKPIDRLKKLDR